MVDRQMWVRHPMGARAVRISPEAWPSHRARGYVLAVVSPPIPPSGAPCLEHPRLSVQQRRALVWWLRGTMQVMGLGHWAVDLVDVPTGEHSAGVAVAVTGDLTVDVWVSPERLVGPSGDLLRALVGMLMRLRGQDQCESVAELVRDRSFLLVTPLIQAPDVDGVVRV